MFAQLSEQVFQHLTQHLHHRSEVGFWGLSRQTASLRVVEMRPEYGAWYAEGRIPGVPGAATAAISVAFTPGEVRIGLIIPSGLLFQNGVDLSETIARALIGSRPHRNEEIAADRRIVDFYFKDGVFSVSSMRDALHDDAMADMIAIRLSYLVATLWKSTLDVIVPRRTPGLFVYALHFSQELSPHALAKAAGGHPVKILYQNQDSDGTWLAIVESALPMDSMQGIAQTLGALSISPIEEQQL